MVACLPAKWERPESAGGVARRRETKCDDGGKHRLAVFEDGSCINWLQGNLCVFYDVSDLLGHYDHFTPDRLSAFEEALADYPVIKKYRNLLTSDSADEEDAG